MNAADSNPIEGAPENDAGDLFGLRVPPEAAGERLDRFVASRLTDLSRSYVQHLIDEGHVEVDGATRRPSFKVSPDELIAVEVPPPVEMALEPEAIPLDIVYEDADVIVINKPAGLVVHPAPGHASGTLVNALLAHAPDISIGGSNRPGIVHRLDKDTSGLMVVAKTDRARSSLLAQWQERTVEKGYVALVSGVVEPDAGTIEAPIGRDQVHRQRMAVTATGRSAVSDFTVRERFADATLVDVAIATGRTHQIRVHLAFIGHSIVGDRVYGRARLGGMPLDRQFLHAARLGFTLPDGEPMRIEAPLPTDLEAVLVVLRGEEAERAG